MPGGCQLLQRAYLHPLDLQRALRRRLLRLRQSRRRRNRGLRGRGRRLRHRGRVVTQAWSLRTKSLRPPLWPRPHGCQRLCAS